MTAVAAAPASRGARSTLAGAGSRGGRATLLQRALRYLPAFRAVIAAERRGLLERRADQAAARVASAAIADGAARAGMPSDPAGRQPRRSGGGRPSSDRRSNAGRATGRRARHCHGLIARARLRAASGVGTAGGARATGAVSLRRRRRRRGGSPRRRPRRRTRAASASRRRAGARGRWPAAAGSGGGSAPRRGELGGVVEAGERLSISSRVDAGRLEARADPLDAPAVERRGGPRRAGARSARRRGSPARRRSRAPPRRAPGASPPRSSRVRSSATLCSRRPRWR